MVGSEWLHMVNIGKQIVAGQEKERPYSQKWPFESIDEKRFGKSTLFGNLERALNVGRGTLEGQ